MITPAELRGVALFHDSSEDTVAFVARNAGDMRAEPGDWILREGETARFFIVVEGKLDIVKMVGGRSTTIGEFAAGDSFGEVPLLLGTPAFANIRAAEKTRLARLDSMQFWHVVHNDERVAQAVFANMARRVDHIREVAYQSPPALCTIVGDSRSPACHELRDFLTRMAVPFEWREREGRECEVEFFDGAPLHSPDARELAQRLGLSVVPQHECYDVVVVGGGPAGLAAAVYGASEGLNTLMIDRYAPGGQAGMSSRIENYLGFPTGISGEDLASRALRQARRFGADILVVREVQAIEGDESHRRVILENGEIVHTRTVVVATGVTYRTLEASGCDTFLNNGVFYGAAQTEAPSVTGHDIHIVGGGNSAGQAAMFFSPYARSVKIVIRASDLRKSMSQYLIDQVTRQQNISVVPGCEVAAVTGDRRIERIALRKGIDGSTHWEPSSGVFVFIGAVPKSDWLEGFLALDDRGFVLTGAGARAASSWNQPRDPYFLETSQPGIFAVGDVRKDSIKRVAAGVGEGSSAISLIHTYLDARPVAFNNNQAPMHA